MQFILLSLTVNKNAKIIYYLFVCPSDIYCDQWLFHLGFGQKCNKCITFLFVTTFFFIWAGIILIQFKNYYYKKRTYHVQVIWMDGWMIVYRLEFICDASANFKSIKIWKSSYCLLSLTWMNLDYKILI